MCPHFPTPSQVTEHEPRRSGVEIYPLIESHRADILTLAKRHSTRNVLAHV